MKADGLRDSLPLSCGKMSSLLLAFAEEGGGERSLFDYFGEVGGERGEQGCISSLFSALLMIKMT